MLQIVTNVFSTPADAERGLQPLLELLELNELNITTANDHDTLSNSYRSNAQNVWPKTSFFGALPIKRVDGSSLYAFNLKNRDRRAKQIHVEEDCSFSLVLE